MNRCDEFSLMQEMQANAQLFGKALGNWQTHVQGCGECAAQVAAAGELQEVLGSEQVPQVSRGFADAVLRRAHAVEAATARPKLPQRKRLALIVNWVVMLLVCSWLAAMIRPAANSLRNPAFVLPVLFLVGTALAALFLPHRFSKSVSAPRQRG